jgi:hypothetical protein
MINSVVRIFRRPHNCNLIGCRRARGHNHPLMGTRRKSPTLAQSNGLPATHPRIRPNLRACSRNQPWGLAAARPNPSSKVCRTCALYVWWYNLLSVINTHWQQYYQVLRLRLEHTRGWNDSDNNRSSRGSCLHSSEARAAAEWQERPLRAVPAYPGSHVLVEGLRNQG